MNMLPDELEHLIEVRDFLSLDDPDYIPPDSDTPPMELLKEISEHICFDILPFCGCGNMIGSVEVVYNYLRIVSLHTEEYNIKTDDQLISDADKEINTWLLSHCMNHLGALVYEKRCDMAKAISEKIFGQKYFTNDPVLQIVAYLCDDVGFTEHGSSINGAWIEDLGRATMYVFGLRIKYDEECRALK